MSQRISQKDQGVVVLHEFAIFTFTQVMDFVVFAASQAQSVTRDEASKLLDIVRGAVVVVIVVREEQ